ncbi:MAG: monoamine oxidase [Acidiferrobacteraceae bacterium]|nr:monoamine oxidase [Acidiferrobacteraceae bacterium]|tara:strand:- start:2493 stop:2978 length:486 start_codon:yes stop_codon:yes gene_type:complete
MTLEPSNDIPVDLYFEDVEIGRKMMTNSHLVTQDAILAFAEITRDRHPLHTDPEYCKNTEYGEPIAHGLFGLSLMEGLKAESRIYEHTSIGSLGWNEVRFVRPLFSGETVHVTFEFTNKRLSRKPGRGIVTENVKLLRENEEILIDAVHVTLLKCKFNETA